MVENCVENSFHSQAFFLIGINIVCTEIHSQVVWFRDGNYTVGFKFLVILSRQ